MPQYVLLTTNKQCIFQIIKYVCKMIIQNMVNCQECNLYGNESKKCLHPNSNGLQPKDVRENNPDCPLLENPIYICKIPCDTNLPVKRYSEHGC